MNLRELTEKQLEERLRRLEGYVERGVVFDDLATVSVDEGVEIASGARIGPNNVLRGRTKIGAGCVLAANCVLTDCDIGEGVTIISSVLEGAAIGVGSTVGPFAYLRPGTVAGAHCRIGDFVELKNAVLGEGTKVSHLTYVGDAELGRDCNVGCGVIFANYDGEKKQRSTVGDEVFLGSNCNVVAPVRVGSGSYVAAGTTVTKDVEENSFVIGRVRQQKLNIAGKYRRKK